MRRALVSAMEQQMWFFGCDAACANGNLLVRYGFQRREREDHHRGKSSRYHFHWVPASATSAPDGDAFLPAEVCLHGWCAQLHCGGEHASGGFLYARAGNRLGWYDSPDLPAPGEYDDHPAARRAFHLLGRRPEPRFCRAAVLFFAWLEEYERWIETACGSDYRQRCHARAPLPWLPPAEARFWLASYRAAITPLAA